MAAPPPGSRRSRRYISSGCAGAGCAGSVANIGTLSCDSERIVGEARKSCSVSRTYAHAGWVDHVEIVHTYYAHRVVAIYLVYIGAQRQGRAAAAAGTQMNLLYAEW